MCFFLSLNPPFFFQFVEISEHLEQLVLYLNPVSNVALYSDVQKWRAKQNLVTFFCKLMCAHSIA